MRTRKINRRAKTNPPRQGSNGPVYTQSPNGSGVPRETEAPKSMQRNTSMTKPGKGTRGSGKGCH